MKSHRFTALLCMIFLGILNLSTLYAQENLDSIQARALAERLYQAQLQQLKPSADRARKDGGISYGSYFAKMNSSIRGEKPADGRSLYISLHGGGNAPKKVNDQQYENQQKLYAPEEGVYVALRAPTDTWNLWHEPHIDNILDSLIRYMVILEDVNPNKVYLMGYSAGGDGVYQLAPRMADRWAAAAMMAGHPGDAAMQSLRNLPFGIYMGALDEAYNRNTLAKVYGMKLDSLQKTDPKGYIYDLNIYEGMPHWMQQKDTVALDWMSQYVRDPHPDRVVWVQDDRLHDRFYWLQIPNITGIEAGKTADVCISGNVIEILENDFDTLYINLNDHLLDLDEEVIVKKNGETLFSGRLSRKRDVMAETVSLYRDQDLIFSARIIVQGGDKISVY